MRRAISLVVFGLMSFASLFAPITNASANSANPVWEGVSSAGVVSGGQTPIVVEKEVLTFDLSALPSDTYNYEENCGSVVAEYTFYNPSEYDITATLDFPFIFSYNADEPKIQTDSEGFVSQMGGYGTTVNGNAVPVKMRYTHAPYKMMNEFSEEDVERVRAAIEKEQFFSDGLPVKRLYFKNPKGQPSLYLLNWRGDGQKSWLVSSGEMTSDIHDDCIDILFYSASVELFVFGECPEEIILKQYGNRNEGDELVDYMGEVAPIQVEEMTFDDYLEQIYSSQDKFSKEQCKSIIISALAVGKEQSFGYAYDYHGQIDKQKTLGWFEYQIEIGSGERLVNTVTAPLFPEIRRNIEPAKYSYTYLLSPAKGWADFSDLEIFIKTPFYLIKSEGFDFERVEGGYKINLDDLPDGELEFTVSSATEWKSRGYVSGCSLSVDGLPVALACAVGFAIILIRKIKNKNEV